LGLKGGANSLKQQRGDIIKQLIEPTLEMRTDGRRDNCALFRAIELKGAVLGLGCRYSLQSGGGNVYVASKPTGFAARNARFGRWSSRARASQITTNPPLLVGLISLLSSTGRISAND
jgi:hypothetical protein